MATSRIGWLTVGISILFTAAPSRAAWYYDAASCTDHLPVLTGTDGMQSAITMIQDAKTAFGDVAAAGAPAGSIWQFPHPEAQNLAGRIFGPAVPVGGQNPFEYHLVRNGWDYMVTNFGTGGTAAPAIPVTGDVVIFCDLSRFLPGKDTFSNVIYTNKNDNRESWIESDYDECNYKSHTVGTLSGASMASTDTFSYPEGHSVVQICPWYFKQVENAKYRSVFGLPRLWWYKIMDWIESNVIKKWWLKNFRQIDAIALFDVTLVHELTHAIKTNSLPNGNAGRVASTNDIGGLAGAYGWDNVRKMRAGNPDPGALGGGSSNADSLAYFALGVQQLKMGNTISDDGTMGALAGPAFTMTPPQNVWADNTWAPTRRLRGRDQFLKESRRSVAREIRRSADPPHLLVPRGNSTIVSGTNSTTRSTSRNSTSSSVSHSSSRTSTSLSLTSTSSTGSISSQSSRSSAAPSTSGSSGSFVSTTYIPPTTGSPTSSSSASSSSSSKSSGSVTANNTVIGNSTTSRPNFFYPPHTAVITRTLVIPVLATIPNFVPSITLDVPDIATFLGLYIPKITNLADFPVINIKNPDLSDINSPSIPIVKLTLPDDKCKPLPKPKAKGIIGVALHVASDVVNGVIDAACHLAVPAINKIDPPLPGNILPPWFSLNMFPSLDSFPPPLKDPNDPEDPEDPDDPDDPDNTSSKNGKTTTSDRKTSGTTTTTRSSTSSSSSSCSATGVPHCTASCGPTTIAGTVTSSCTNVCSTVTACSSTGGTITMSAQLTAQSLIEHEAPAETDWFENQQDLLASLLANAPDKLPDDYFSTRTDGKPSNTGLSKTSSSPTSSISDQNSTVISTSSDGKPKTTDSNTRSLTQSISSDGKSKTSTGSLTQSTSSGEKNGTTDSNTRSSTQSTSSDGKSKTESSAGLSTQSTNSDGKSKTASNTGSSTQSTNSDGKSNTASSTGSLTQSTNSDGTSKTASSTGSLTQSTNSDGTSKTASSSGSLTQSTNSDGKPKSTDSSIGSSTQSFSSGAKSTASDSTVGSSTQSSSSSSDRIPNSADLSTRSSTQSESSSRSTSDGNQKPTDSSSISSTQSNTSSNGKPPVTTASTSSTGGKPPANPSTSSSSNGSNGNSTSISTSSDGKAKTSSTQSDGKPKTTISSTISSSEGKPNTSSGTSSSDGNPKTASTSSDGKPKSTSASSGTEPTPPPSQTGKLCKGNQVNKDCIGAILPSATTYSGSDGPYCQKADQQADSLPTIGDDAIATAANDYCGKLISGGVVLKEGGAGVNTYVVSQGAYKGRNAYLNVVYSKSYCPQDKGTSELDFVNLGLKKCYSNMYKAISTVCRMDDTWENWDPDWPIEGGVLGADCGIWAMTT